jgi:hypothetical protein
MTNNVALFPRVVMSLEEKVGVRTSSFFSLGGESLRHFILPLSVLYCHYSIPLSTLITYSDTHALVSTWYHCCHLTDAKAGSVLPAQIVCVPTWCVFLVPLFP